eukprot:COSAG04_NODE_1764_length_5651_cov_2.599244_2_plen_556_part_00
MDLVRADSVAHRHAAVRAHRTRSIVEEETAADDRELRETEQRIAQLTASQVALEEEEAAARRRGGGARGHAQFRVHRGAEQLGVDSPARAEQRRAELASMGRLEQDSAAVADVFADFAEMLDDGRQDKLDEVAHLEIVDELIEGCEELGEAAEAHAWHVYRGRGRAAAGIVAVGAALVPGAPVLLGLAGAAAVLATGEGFHWLTTAQITAQRDAMRRRQQERRRLPQQQQPLQGQAAAEARWEKAASCRLCASPAPWSAMHRRHHCRSCGASVCDAHARHRRPLPPIYPKPVRICDTCAATPGESEDEGEVALERQQSLLLAQLESAPDDAALLTRLGHVSKELAARQAEHSTVDLDLGLTLLQPLPGVGGQGYAGPALPEGDTEAEALRRLKRAQRHADRAAGAGEAAAQHLAAQGDAIDGLAERALRAEQVAADTTAVDDSRTITGSVWTRLSGKPAMTAQRVVSANAVPLVEQLQPEPEPEPWVSAGAGARERGIHQLGQTVESNRRQAEALHATVQRHGQAARRAGEVTEAAAARVGRNERRLERRGASRS